MANYNPPVPAQDQQDFPITIEAAVRSNNVELFRFIAHIHPNWSAAMAEILRNLYPGDEFPGGLEVQQQVIPDVAGVYIAPANLNDEEKVEEVNISRKLRTFLTFHDLNGVRVTALPGIRERYSERMAARSLGSFVWAHQVVDTFISMHKNEEQFIEFLKKEFRINKHHAYLCFACISRWCNEHPNYIPIHDGQI